jgi:predicted AAA+ superfamily ATPase
MRVPNLQTKGNDLETIIYLELKRRGYKVYYYKTSNNLECDFLLEDENKLKTLIQVTTSLKDEKTKKRELRSFSRTISELQLKDVECQLICEDNSNSEVYDNVEIQIINIKEWLLNL